MKKFKPAMVSLIISGLMLVTAPSVVMADFFSGPCNTQNTSSSIANPSDNPACNGSSGDTNPIVHVVQVATSIMALLAGVLAVIMIIVGGFQIVTSAGNAEAVAGGRKKVVNAAVGLAIVALSWTIIRLVTDHIIQ